MILFVLVLACYWVWLYLLVMCRTGPAPTAVVGISCIWRCCASPCASADSRLATDVMLLVCLRRGPSCTTGLVVGVDGCDGGAVTVIGVGVTITDGDGGGVTASLDSLLLLKTAFAVSSYVGIGLGISFVTGVR